MKNTKISLKLFSLIGLALILTVSSCKKEEEPEPETEQPTLPPENAFVQDMSGFGSDDASRDDANFKFAGLNVGIWNIILFVNLVVPVAAWHEVRKAQPTWSFEDKAWIWSRTFNNAQGDFTASLHGAVNGSNVNWKMYVSKAGGFQNFLWYEGDAKLNRESGDWRLYADPDNARPYIDIEWENDVDGDYDNIKYTNVIPEDEGNGGYIHYGRVENEDFETFYDIYGKKDDRLIEIDYNAETTAGRVRDDVRFGDEDWHCWDETKEDIDCP